MSLVAGTKKTIELPIYQSKQKIYRSFWGFQNVLSLVYMHVLRELYTSNFPEEIASTNQSIDKSSSDSLSWTMNNNFQWVMIKLNEYQLTMNNDETK